MEQLAKSFFLHLVRQLLTRMPAYQRIYYISGAASGETASSGLLHALRKLSGLGLASAEALHRKGAYCVLLDLNEEAGKQVEQRLGERSLFAKADVRSEQDISKAIERAEAKWPNVKTAGAICCGGVGFAQPCLSLSCRPTPN
jgi:NAD(P)-dependent dehydrogenase (short-subunit alcohol dehydrogenase family)